MGRLWWWYDASGGGGELVAMEVGVVVRWWCDTSCGGDGSGHECGVVRP